MVSYIAPRFLVLFYRCVCVYERGRACARACMRACERARVHARASAFFVVVDSLRGTLCCCVGGLLRHDGIFSAVLSQVAALQLLLGYASPGSVFQNCSSCLILVCTTPSVTSLSFLSR